MVIQQLIQSQLFHLISMLACIGVVTWLLVRHYFHDDSKSEDKKLRMLNLLYISGILVFIIIELVTAICMDNTRHADILSFVSFAATLSSLILSVVAIIFTIVFSNRGEFQYQKLDNVSEEVKDSLTRFTEKTDTFDASVDRFKTIADDLSRQLHEIYEKLNGIEPSIFEMRDQIMTPVNTNRDIKTKSGNTDGSFESRVAAFISHGSFSGNLALYACVLSNEKSRPFMMSQIKENEDDEAYKFGYIIAASSIGTITTHVSGQRSIQVSYFYPGLKEMIEEALQVFIDKIDEPSAKQSSTNQISSIKKIFE